MFKYSCLAAAFLVFVAVSSAQQQPETKNGQLTPETSQGQDLSKDAFAELLRKRDGLTDDVGSVNTKIGLISFAIAKRAELDQAKASHMAPSKIAEIQEGISSYLEHAHIAGTPLAELEKQREKWQSAIAADMENKGRIDQELSYRADVVAPQQAFKKSMSQVFAYLVGLVIICFFGVAIKDEQVRREIFAGQAGIQFVALFSLIIAIILFGIQVSLKEKSSLRCSVDYPGTYWAVRCQLRVNVDSALALPRAARQIPTMGTRPSSGIQVPEDLQVGASQDRGSDGSRLILCLNGAPVLVGPRARKCGPRPPFKACFWP